MYLSWLKKKLIRDVLGLALVPLRSLWVDANEAGRLLEALWTKAFDQLQLISVEKRPVLFSPLHYASCPACIQTCNMSTKKKSKHFLWFFVSYNIQWTFEYYRMLNRHWLSILCISHLTATLKSWMFWKLVTATDVNTSLTLHILSENCTLKVDPKGMEILFHINQILTCSRVKY